MKKTILLSLFCILFCLISCKKKPNSDAPVDPRVPPDMVLKTGINYTFKDSTVTKNDTLIIGIVVTKTEDNLSNFNASVAYDGNSATTTFFNHYLSSNEYSGYTVDVPYYVRNQIGTEVLIFSIVDRDGNITRKSITLTVI